MPYMSGEKNKMRAHLVYRFDELEVTFYKCYQKVQMHEQVYMALWMIKQGGDEKVEIYYKCILKLANYLQHQAYDSLLTTFFQL
jgi:hypothetical protein